MGTIFILFRRFSRIVENVTIYDAVFLWRKYEKQAFALFQSFETISPMVFFNAWQTCQVRGEDKTTMDKILNGCDFSCKFFTRNFLSALNVVSLVGEGRTWKDQILIKERRTIVLNWEQMQNERRDAEGRCSEGERHGPKLFASCSTRIENTRQTKAARINNESRYREFSSWLFITKIGLAVTELQLHLVQPASRLSPKPLWIRNYKLPRFERQSANTKGVRSAHSFRLLMRNLLDE